MFRLILPFGLAAAALAAYPSSSENPIYRPEIETNNQDGTIFVKLEPPFTVNTWNFKGATQAASQVLKKNGTALDAVEQGVNWCEMNQCDGTVGFGGSPAEDGSVFLDAMIIDGETHRCGSVLNLPNVKKAISVARGVTTFTSHSILTGESAGKFATDMKYETDPKLLRTSESDSKWKQWQNEQCQPNYRQNVVPEPSNNCGPYRPASVLSGKFEKPPGHDTIGLIAVDTSGKLALGTSTNGMKFKVPGRVADSAIPGAGGYAEKDVGAAVATGDGDVIVAYATSAIAVDRMQLLKVRPDDAARQSLSRLNSYGYPYSAAVVVAKPNGEVGAACAGFSTFTMSFWDSKGKVVRTTEVKCPSTN